MHGSSGIRTLLVLVLLFTMVSAVSGLELLNETSDFGFLMENKIIVQVESDSSLSVEGVLSVVSDNLKPAGIMIIATADPYIGDEMDTPTDLTYKNDLNYTDISELREGVTAFCSLYKQLFFS